MRIAARLARIGDRLVSLCAVALILLLLLYGGYSLWDTAMLYRGAFVSDELLQFKPTGERPGENPTLEELRAVNPDVVGWLTIDNTHIDYPLVIGETDLEYVNRDVYGDFSLSGALFLDSGNARDFSDGYTLIYGHHMDNGAMFGDVVEFVDGDYFQAHPTGTLYLPEATYHIELFACVEVDAYDRVIYHPLDQPAGDISALLDYVDGIAVQRRPVGVGPADRVVGLSTCAEAATNGRVVIFGRLEPMG